MILVVDPADPAEPAVSPPQAAGPKAIEAWIVEPATCPRAWSAARSTAVAGAGWGLTGFGDGVLGGSPWHWGRPSAGPTSGYFYYTIIMIYSWGTKC